MKKSKLVLTISLYILSLLFFNSCKKTNNENSQTNNENLPSFNWTYFGINYIATSTRANVPTVAIPKYVVSGNLEGRHAGPAVIFELTSFNVDTYIIDSALGNTMLYTDSYSTYLTKTSGTVTITSNSNNLLSGHFATTVLSIVNTTDSLTGSFTDIQIN